MTRPFLELERLEHRVLGALRFLDGATGGEIPGPLELSAVQGEARFVRNRSGLAVLWSWSEMAEHGEAFRSPPEEQPLGSVPFRLQVRDPSGRYLPRAAAVDLPRDPGPDLRDTPDSLFQPAEVVLFRAPAASTGTNWAVVRATVQDPTTGDRLGGALLRVLRGGEVIARGLTDGRGDGVVAVVGIPMLTFGAGDPDDEEDDGAVVVATVAVQVEAVFPSATGTRFAAEDLEAGARPPIPVVDPDAVEEDAAAPRGQAPLTIGARRTTVVTLPVSVP